MGYLRPIECERTRHALSAGLDGELSPFESTLVAVHVERCQPCRSFQAQITGITTAVREASLERPGLHVAVPTAGVARWPSTRRVASVSAAAAVLVVALVGFATAPDRSTWSGNGALIASALDRRSSTSDLLIDVIRPRLAARRHDAIAYGEGGIGAYKPPLEEGI